LDIQIRFVTIQIVIFLFMTACKQRIENPELADPIYHDLVLEVKSALVTIGTETKEIKAVKEQIAALSAKDTTRGGLLRELAMHERTLVQAKQNHTYFKVRSEQRRLYDLETYERTFAEDTPWPDPEEIAEYRKVKKLQSSSRNWDDRVPKTTRYNRAPAIAVKRDEPKADSTASAPKH
jgi:hypothetical protein